MGEEAADELKQEKGRVDGNHNLDPGGLGHQRLVVGRHGELRLRQSARGTGRTVYCGLTVVMQSEYGRRAVRCGAARCWRWDEGVKREVYSIFPS